MLIAEIWGAFFYILTGLPAVALLVYATIILYYGNKKTLEREITFQNMKFQPTVSVVVATHNEEMIISKKIENLLLSDYPLGKMEIVFADDSDDSTPEIISKRAITFSSIRLLHFEERMGYSPSMLAGCNAANGEIIVLNDAASFLDSQAISKIVDNLRNPDIGVVTGRDDILNINEGVGASESLYQKLYNFLRKAETNMGSTFFVKGEATGVRKAVFDGMKTASETFDTAVGLVARSKGYKVVYDPEIRFYEYAPATHSDRIKQKTIRAANLIKVLWRFKSMMFKQKYGKYGSLILPSNFALLTLVPVFIALWFVSLIVFTLFYPAMAIYFWLAIGVALLALASFSKRLVFTFFEFEYSLISAICQVLFTKKTHDKIEKVASTRRL